MPISRFILISVPLLACSAKPALADELANVAEAIRLEATRSNHGEAGRPLPLAGHWNGMGAERLGFTPAYQLDMIKKGSHLLPWLLWPPTNESIHANFKAVFVGIKPEPGLVCRLLMKGAMRDGMKSWIWLSGWDKVDFHLIPDASGAGNIGFLAGGKWVQDDERGQVLELNGLRDRVEIGNTPDINAGAAYPNRTIAFWFKGQAEPKPDKKKEQRRVLYEEGGPGSGINLYLDDNVLRAGVWKDGKGSWLESKDTGNGWRHVAFVLRTAAKDAGPAIELYLDGQKVAAGTAPALGAHVADINIGRSGSTLFHDGRSAPQPGFPFAGRIDDFRISNRALSAEEVRELAKAK